MNALFLARDSVKAKDKISYGKGQKRINSIAIIIILNFLIVLKKNGNFFRIGRLEYVFARGVKNSLALKFLN